ncbi:hypothetical protein Avbf_16499 [Armadillidium vulgare]|nr:hypothetical protein Avbf_16499 [Armadillidium vulgare]
MGDWLRGFVRLHNLYLRKGVPVKVARKIVTSDAFVIFEFYSLLEEKIEGQGIKKRPECIWNLDETNVSVPEFLSPEKGDFEIRFLKRKGQSLPRVFCDGICCLVFPREGSLFRRDFRVVLWLVFQLEN